MSIEHERDGHRLGGPAAAPNPSLGDLTPDGIFQLDTEGRIVQANQACSRILEYAPAELEALRFSSIVAKSHWGLAQSIFARTMQGHAQQSELLLQTKVQRIIAVSLQTVPYEVHGTVVGIVGSAQDLSRLQTMEHALGDSESLLPLVMRLAHVGRWVWDERHHQIQPSPELFELMRWDPGSEPLMNVEAFVRSIAADDQAIVEAALIQAIEQQTSLSVQFRLVRSPDDRRVYTAMAEPRRDASGTFLGLVGMVQDITEMTLLSESQKQLASVFEHSRDLVMVADLEGFLRYCNRTCRQTLGMSETEFLHPINLSELRLDADRESVTHQLQTALSEGAWRGDLWLKHRDGHAIPVSTVIQCHRDESGRPRFFSGVARDVTHERALEEHIRYQADHDSLTGLLNRGRFTERLGEYLQSLGPGLYATVGFIDLNDFKQINDIHGHTIGDHLLAAVATRLSRHFDQPEILARWGGDEFTFWLPSSNATQATAWLDSLVPDLERSYVIHDSPFELIPAVGLAVFPDDGKDVETLVRKADAAMFEAKRRDAPYLFHTEAMSAEADQRKETREAIRTGIREHQFLAYFQPIIAASSGLLESAEALMRWNHPTRGILPPSEFMAEAERSALIVPLGLHMLKMVGAAISDWHHAGLNAIRIAVNFSARQLMQDDLANAVERICEAHRINPQWVECEITETAILENHDLARKTLTNLRAHGFRVVLDDFGTGYSSLSHLRDLPIDGIKLDRSFINQLPDHPRETAIAKSTIRLAHDLDLNVTAEGVETAIQAKFLISEGCDLLQGYGISHPLPPEAFLHWREQYHPQAIG